MKRAYLRGMTNPPHNIPLAEWAPHDAMWIGFPSHEELWEDDLAPAQAEVAALATALHADGEGEEVRLVAANEEAAAEARRLCPFATVIVEPFGDIWLRDTGPIVTGTGADRRAQGFGFNGWGGKYELEGDDSVGERLAATTSLPYAKADWILEGGAVDGDGTGTYLTTEECLLNKNRNPGLSREDIEARLKRDLGATRVVWLGKGLVNDHTDGHVDNLARFVGEGRVAIPEPMGEDDPNEEAYAEAAAALLEADLEVTAIPSPGAVIRPDPETGEDRIVPASYMNFLIGNAAVVVPLYGSEADLAAIEAIGGLFPDRRVTGIRADHILTGGGSFHCISQQVPR
ncbi:agmatine deiminase family protein [Sphingomicrobium aestuariivivum]|uniref:agmatine deiminase family protein n=1 Tax=Sphingomicrobium aestuariivivum TaxID=1582356 RepID=UPI001FD6CEB4|nr:agmatine deiminase family protein [Sphingomicrobium aestuariivivum]MCJ8190167.1 agmatine deiminase family protein [Sphingomicrobium aestuariivivum]